MLMTRAEKSNKRAYLGAQLMLTTRAANASMLSRLGAQLTHPLRKLNAGMRNRQWAPLPTGAGDKGRRVCPGAPPQTAADRAVGGFI